MALVVSLSQGVLANLLALQNTTNAMNTVQNQLATGKRVNTALDDPTNFFWRTPFKTNINTLNSLLDTINLGQRTIEAANNGITSLTSLLQTAQGSLNQALASAPTTSVLTGTAVNLTATTTFLSLGFANTDVITVNDGTTNTTTFTAASTQTVQALLNFINAGGNTTNNRLRAEIFGDGRVLIEGTTAAASVTITTNSVTTTAIQNLGFNATASNGTINNTAAAGTLNTTRQALAAQFDALRTQIDQLAVDFRLQRRQLAEQPKLDRVHERDVDRQGHPHRQQRHVGGPRPHLDVLGEYVPGQLRNQRDHHGRESLARQAAEPGLDPCVAGVDHRDAR